MSLRFQLPPVYFIHLVKTSGVALGEHLASAYAARDVLTIRGGVKLARQTLAGLRGYRCYICHYGCGLYELIGRSDLVSITLLRDPVERAISHIYYHPRELVRYPNIFTPEYRAEMQPLLSADLRTCLEVPAFLRLADNWQTRELGIVRDYRPYLKDGAAGARLLLPAQAPALTEEHNMAQIIPNARKRLERMAVVGITERFAESVELICDRLGFPMPAQLPQANIGPRKRGVDVRGYRATTPPDLIEHIEELTRYDQELYAYACELFEQQLARHRAQPRRTYSIAPRLRMAVRRVRSRAKQYL